MHCIILFFINIIQIERASNANMGVRAQEGAEQTYNYRSEEAQSEWGNIIFRFVLSFAIQMERRGSILL